MVKILNTIKNGAVFFCQMILMFLIITLWIISNIILFPFGRIPRGKKQVFELPVMIKAIQIACLYRDSAEGIFGHRVIFFSREDDLSKPYFLYLKIKELEKLPQELLKYEGPIKARKKEKTIVLTVEARKSLLCGYLPARILGYDVIDQKPEFYK